MNLVRDCPEARWLPARHHFALMRLIAFLRARYGGAVKSDVDRLVLAIDGGQSAIENYGVAIWIFATVACYVAAALPLSPAMAALVAIPLALAAIQLPLCVVGPLWNFIARAKGENNQKLISVFMMTAMFIASSYFGAALSPVRYVAWFFFAVVIANALAWIIMATLRGPVRQLEQRCGI